MNIPTLLKTYFAASNNEEVEKQVECFKENASVIDENETYLGATEIKKWIINSHTKYKFNSKIIDVKDSGQNITVTATVSGNFPGSLVNLKYDFIILDEKIQRLEIGV